MKIKKPLLFHGHGMIQIENGEIDFNIWLKRKDFEKMKKYGTYESWIPPMGGGLMETIDVEPKKKNTIFLEKVM